MNSHNSKFEDDDIDDNVVRDGQVLRASMLMMDSTQRAVMATSQQLFGDDDAQQNDAVAALKAYEAWRKNLTQQDQTIGEKVMAMHGSPEMAQQNYLTWLNSAWRDPSSAFPKVTADRAATNDASAEPATLADSYELYHKRLVNSWRNPPSMVPTIPSNNAESLLSPPSASMTDERTKLYQSYNERISRLWENPL